MRFWATGGWLTMEIVPRKENSYWKHDQVGVRPKDMPVAFYSFVRLRALEL